MPSPFTQVEERAAASRIRATKQRYRRTQTERDRDANRALAYRSRPEVAARRKVAGKLWRLKYAIPSTPITKKVRSQCPSPRPTVSTTVDFD